MGGCCCGLQGHGTHLAHSTTEPLLRDSEREAVSAILKFLDSGLYVNICGNGSCRCYVKWVSNFESSMGKVHCDKD